MLTRSKKEQLVKEITEVLKSKNGVVFSDFAGLTTGELSELKTELRKYGSSYAVVKKSLLPFAAKESGVELTLDEHKGSVAIAYGEGEGVEIAKTLVGFAKTHEKLGLLGILLNRVFGDASKVKELAALPSREELVAKLMYLFSPGQTFVRTLNAPLVGLLNVLNSIKDKK